MKVYVFLFEALAENILKEAQRQADQILAEAKQKASKMLQESGLAVKHPATSPSSASPATSPAPSPSSVSPKVASALLRKLSSSDFVTPPRQTVRTQSPQTSGGSDASKGKVQHSLAKFWGSPEEQQQDKPVLRTLELQPRVHKSKAMRAVEALQKEMEDQLMKHEEVDEVGKEREEEMERLRLKKLRSRGGRPKSSEALVIPGDQTAKKVVDGAKKKLSLVHLRRRISADTLRMPRVAIQMKRHCGKHAG